MSMIELEKNPPSYLINLVCRLSLLNSSLTDIIVCFFTFLQAEVLQEFYHWTHMVLSVLIYLFCMLTAVSIPLLYSTDTTWYVNSAGLSQKLYLLWRALGRNIKTHRSKCHKRENGKSQVGTSFLAIFFWVLRRFAQAGDSPATQCNIYSVAENFARGLNQEHWAGS